MYSSKEHEFMSRIDIVMSGHVSKDIMVFHDGTKDSFFGGPVIYSSAAAAVSGSRVMIVTKTAETDRASLDYLREDRVGLEIIDSRQTTSIRNVYHTADQERRDVTLISSAEPFVLEEISRHPARLYHLAGLFWGELPIELIRPLSERGDVAVDAQGLLRRNESGEMRFRDWPEKRQILPYVRYLKTDAAEASILTGLDDRDEAARVLCEWGATETMVTHHTEVIVCSGNRIFRAPFRPKTLVGRTGRGDTCFASYLSRRLQGDNPDQAVRFAAALTSMKMEKNGRFSGTSEEVYRRMGH